MEFSSVSGEEGKITQSYDSSLSSSATCVEWKLSSKYLILFSDSSLIAYEKCWNVEGIELDQIKE